jgi:hypothetical protein
MLKEVQPPPATRCFLHSSPVPSEHDLLLLVLNSLPVPSEHDLLLLVFHSSPVPSEHDLLLLEASGVAKLLGQ